MDPSTFTKARHGSGSAGGSAFTSTALGVESFTTLLPADAGAGAGAAGAGGVADGSSGAGAPAAFSAATSARNRSTSAFIPSYVDVGPPNSPPFPMAI